jgi:predicted amidohydrolase
MEGSDLDIGFVQFAPVLGNLQATIERIEELSTQCAGADLLVLPELCNSGYNFASKEQAWATSEEIAGSDFIRYLESLCARLGCHIVSGMNERCGSHLYNTAVLVGPQGYVGKYRKLHLFFNEKDFFEPGDVGLPVFDIGASRIGMLVCFDWIFPEAWRVLTLKGADIICHPSNLVLPGLAQQAVPVHALINRIYVVTANRVGSEGDLTFTGMSTIADPRGQVLAQGSRTHPEVSRVEMDISLARTKDITARNNLFDDRRPQEYQLLTKQQTG